MSRIVTHDGSSKKRTNPTAKCHDPSVTRSGHKPTRERYGYQVNVMVPYDLAGMIEKHPAFVEPMKGKRSGLNWFLLESVMLRLGFVTEDGHEKLSRRLRGKPNKYHWINRLAKFIPPAEEKDEEPPW